MENKKPKKKIYKRWWFWIIVLVIIGAIGSQKDKSQNSVDNATNKTVATDTTKKEEPKKEETKKPETKVTYENFQKVNMGASLEDVVALLGEGKEMSSSEIAGIKTVMYTWNGTGMGNMNVMFQNGIVTNKAQAFLKSMDAKVTLDKYNQVKDGMTYDQVKAILGDGQITSQGKLMDIETIIYAWINKDGSNLNCTFQGNKMSMKAQFNLK